VLSKQQLNYCADRVTALGLCSASFMHLSRICYSPAVAHATSTACSSTS